MRTVAKELERYRVPFDHELWTLDQIINERGIPIDPQYVRNAIRLVAEQDAKTRTLLAERTGLRNPNSDQQIKGWVAANGYGMKSIAKAKVIEALLDPAIPERVRDVLAMRDELSGAGCKKLLAIKARVSSDYRLRQQFKMCAADTGRWGGDGAQPQNMPRPSKAVTRKIVEVTETLRLGRLPDDLSPIEAITSSIRSAIRPRPGYKLIVCDFNAIEPRLLAWLSGCKPMLQVFAENRDLYIDFATHLFHKPHADVDDHERTVAKPGVLAGGYGQGPAGLVKYAKGLGIRLTEDEAAEHVATFRQTYTAIPMLWYEVERRCMCAIQTGKPAATLKLGYNYDPELKLLRIRLPSKRVLHYREAAIETGDEDWKQNIVYTRFDKQRGRRDVRCRTWGSRLVENIVQAAARDVLVNALFQTEAAGLHPIAHVHDEIICELPESEAEAGHERLRQIMSTLPAWAPDLLLKAKGDVMDFYAK